MSDMDLWLQDIFAEIDADDDPEEGARPTSFWISGLPDLREQFAQSEYSQGKRPPVDKKVDLSKLSASHFKIE